MRGSLLGDAPDAPLDEIVVDDGVVVGLRGRDASGRTVTERARVVIGADGWSSRVVRTVHPR